MKTPLDNFKITRSSKNTPFGGINIFITAQHNSLPLKIVEGYFIPPVNWFKSEDTLESIDERLLTKLNTSILEIAEKGRAIAPIIINDIITGEEILLYFGE